MNQYLEALDKIRAKKEAEAAKPPAPKPQPENSFGDAGYFFPKKK